MIANGRYIIAYTRVDGLSVEVMPIQICKSKEAATSFFDDERKRLQRIHLFGLCEGLKIFKDVTPDWKQKKRGEENAAD